MPTWSDLLPEILNKIAGKFEFFEDFVTFLGVCSSWRLSVVTSKRLIQRLPSRFPALMLSESKTKQEHEQEFRRFFLLSNGGMIRRVKLPEARWQRCISANGWLVTTGEEEFFAKILHPLYRIQIDLPELYMFEEYHYDQDEWKYYGHCLRKVVFTSSPFDPSFRVVIIWGRTIGFCRLGDVSWTRIKGWEGDLFDITYHTMRKRLYVMAKMGSIYECDILSGESRPLILRRLSTFPEDFACLFLGCAYVLEWGRDSLLMVTREREYYKKDDNEFGLFGPYKTKRFHCFEFSLVDGKWSKLMSLDEKAAFLGFNSSFSINASGDVKPNCIYFTDDLYEPYRDLPNGGGRDVGVYHTSDSSIEPILGSQNSLFLASPPLWLQPSTVPTLKKI